MNSSGIFTDYLYGSLRESGAELGGESFWNLRAGGSAARISAEMHLPLSSRSDD
jgi:hypothetical protein